MLDDLREQASSSDYFEDEEEDVVEEVDDPTFNYNEPDTQTSSGPFLGMTPTQRFVIAVMLMLMVCVMSMFFLVLTEKIYLPFL
jgi:hypothetical protein